MRWRASPGAAAFTLFAVTLTLAAALAFYAPALAATRGDWPAPLDDVFIHFDFARAAAGLHPFAWIAGQGYSSGETSPLYAALLAVGYAAGFRGLSLGLWAAALACAALVATMRALRELTRTARPWVAWLGALTLVSVGALDWTWFSGMEGAACTAAIAVTLVHARRAREAPPAWRRLAQWRVGAWCAALVLLRPEASLVVALVAVAVARRAYSQSAVGALARCAGPACLVGLALVAANFVATGEAASAGAIAKLLAYRPFLRDVDRAEAWVSNLVHVGLFFGGQLGRGTLWAWLLPSLAVPALVSRRTRALASVCVLGALGWASLVSANDAARFQNFRYYVPALALTLFASTLGLGELSRRRRLGPAGALVALGGAALAATGLPAQIAFFAGAAGNIHDQQVEVGRRLAARMGPGESVLVGDAGAIAYVSRRHAVDALGLGGSFGLPFARAALDGQGAIVELIERLPRDARPRFLALYPTWFGDITRTFGREVDRVSLAHNLVCGGVTKGIYEADWSSLADGTGDDVPAGPGDVRDAIDVADVVSEGEHGYVSPAPRGGWTTLALHAVDAGRLRFDAGRIIPRGERESFTLRSSSPAPADLVVRTDEADASVALRVSRRGHLVASTRLEPGSAPREGAWTSYRASVGALEAGDVVTLDVLEGTLRDYHVWVIVRDGRAVVRESRLP